MPSVAEKRREFRRLRAQSGNFIARTKTREGDAAVYAAHTSRVTGWIDGDTFELAASLDPFSKRFVAQLIPRHHDTEIEYQWIDKMGNLFWGAPETDEDEVLEFLREWLQAVPEENPDDGDAGDAEP